MAITVGQLIEKLKEFDPDSTVGVWDSEMQSWEKVVDVLPLTATSSGDDEKECEAPASVGLPFVSIVRRWMT